MRVLALAILGGACLVIGCAPKLESRGSLSIDGATFQPVACHVLVRALGIELLDASGARLELTLPPARLEAFKEVGGPPHVRLDRGGREAPADLGSCGTLTLRGEGYHAQSKRAAGGHLTLACGAPSVKGELDFSGCF